MNFNRNEVYTQKFSDKFIEKLKKDPNPSDEIAKQGNFAGKGWQKDDWKKLYFMMDYNLQKCLFDNENLRKENEKLL
jgi:hypothetical protein